MVWSSYRQQKWSAGEPVSVLCATYLPRVTPTLARKLEAVHNITVARRRMIPIVCRQTLGREFCCSGGVLSGPVRDLCDHVESVDLLTACECSEREIGTGKTRLSAGTGARDGLIATLSFSKMNVESWCSTSGSLCLPDCSTDKNPDPCDPWSYNKKQSQCLKLDCHMGS